MDARPIDANALVGKLVGISETYNKIYDEWSANDYNKYIVYGKFTALIDTILQVQREEPTLDYAPVVHGEWIECPTYDEDGYYFVDYKCSECGRFVPIEEPYCHCGAKMDGKGDDHEQT